MCVCVLQCSAFVVVVVIGCLLFVIDTKLISFAVIQSLTLDPALAATKHSQESNVYGCEEKKLLFIRYKISSTFARCAYYVFVFVCCFARFSSFLAQMHVMYIAEKCSR